MARWRHLIGISGGFGLETLAVLGWNTHNAQAVLNAASRTTVLKVTPQHRADIALRAQVRRQCDRRTGFMRRRRERDPDAGRRRPRGGGAGGAPVRELQRLKGVNVKLITACTAIKQIDADPICIFAEDAGGVVGYGAPEGAKLLLSGPANKLRRHSGLIQATR